MRVHRQCGRGVIYCVIYVMACVQFMFGITWRRGVVVSVVRCWNEVILRRARLVLGWVTIFARVYHHGV